MSITVPALNTMKTGKTTWGAISSRIFKEQRLQRFQGDMYGGHWDVKFKAAFCKQK